MKKYEELFELIHSLSKSEKRHFRMFVGNGGSGRNYLLLFDEIAGQQVYNEQLIKEKFIGHKFTEQLHVTKNYLKALVLKSLRNYHSKISKKAQLNDLLRNTEILFNKELYSMCKSSLKQAQRLAEEYELDAYLVEVFQWKRKVIQAISPFDIVSIQQTIKDEEQAITSLHNTFGHKKHNVKIYDSFLNSSNLSGPGDILQDTASSADTLEAKVYFYHSNYYHYIRKNAYSQAEETMFELIGFLEDKPHRISEDPGLYVSTVNNFLGYLVFSQQPQKALDLLKRAKNNYVKWKADSKSKIVLKQVLRSYNIELEIHRDKQRTGEQMVKIEHIKEFFALHEEQAPMEYAILFRYQFASIYFMQKDYAESLKWINKLLNMSSRQVRVDLQVYARILNLMIHFEMNNLFVLGYYIDSTRRYLKKNNVYDNWKKQLLNFFSTLRRIPEYESGLSFEKIFSLWFPQDKEALISKDVLDYIDLKSWISYRIK